MDEVSIRVAETKFGYVSYMRLLFRMSSLNSSLIQVVEVNSRI
jgi:hypothetical protein